MTVNVSEFLQILLTVAWRRKLLIIFPILIFAGLSVVAARYWPRTYIAQTLIMLQEGKAADPLNYGGGRTQRTQLRKAEVDTLLKSERVLRGAVLDFNIGGKALTPKDIENEIKDLRDIIHVKIVGREFVSVELHGQNPVGMADRLSIIVTRFFERLFSRVDEMKTARQFAFEQRKRDLEISENALSEWVARNGALIASDNINDNIARIAELKRKRSEAEQRLKEEARFTIQGPVELNTILSSLSQSRRSSLYAGSNSDSGTLAQTGELERLLQAYEDVHSSLVEVQRSTIAAINLALKSSQSASGPVHLELVALKARHNEAVEQFKAHMAQAKKSKAPALPPFGLINPELIRVVDEPHDPVSPATSILKIILACAAAGIGLGVGMAALAEQFDDTIYDARDLGRLSGIDIVISLPEMDKHSKEQDDRALEANLAELKPLELVQNRA